MDAVSGACLGGVITRDVWSASCSLGFGRDLEYDTDGDGNADDVLSSNDGATWEFGL